MKRKHITVDAGDGPVTIKAVYRGTHGEVPVELTCDDIHQATIIMELFLSNDPRITYEYTQEAWLGGRLMVDKVWAVTSGQYSDYQVLALFPTKELAEEAAAIATGSEKHGPLYGYSVEEFPLRTTMPKPFTVYYMDDGGVVKGERTGEVREWSTVVISWDDSVKPIHYRPVVSVNEEHGTVYVKGSDQEKVRKALYDTVAQVKAEREGLT